MVEITNQNDAVELRQLPPGKHGSDDRTVQQHLLTGESESENDPKQPSITSGKSVEHSANSVSTVPSTLSNNTPATSVNPELHRLDAGTDRSDNFDWHHRRYRSCPALL
jgi:hypothetical protein